ncbi:hypothetical protein BH11GEM2_BH11GEM2_01990 [soil metagenome]
MTLSIVVTDADQRAALATVRSLGRAGHRVHLAATAPHSLAGASRFAASESVVPDPLVAPEEFNQALRGLVANYGAHVLLPMSEAALLAVLPDRDRFDCEVPFTTADRFDRICDKRAVLAAAHRIGIAVPAQQVLQSATDVPSLAKGPFPMVLKPARSVVGEKGARSKTSVRYARGARQLADLVAGLPGEDFPVLCQQRIEGPGTAVSLLLWDGEVKAAFAHRRLREKPPSGGVSVLRESIPLDPDLVAKSVALLREFGWQGVAMVEYKIDSATGTPYLMEINGRFWGSLQLAIDAGVDFPRLLVDCVTQAPVTPVLDYPAGVRTRWEWGEVDHLLVRMRRSRASLSLPKDAPSRFGAVRAFLSSFAPSVHNEVFARDDVRPFLRESANWLRGK